MGQSLKCAGCRGGTGFDVPITMAFQPILNMETRTVFAYEALLRGKTGAGAADILAAVTNENRYAFDQRCRVTAIEAAKAVDLARDGALLSINFLPNAVYEPLACIRLTLETAERTGFPVNRIMFEFTEGEYLDTDHLLNILRTYRKLGFKTAIDDFGAGYAGLELLSRFQPDVVKMDMALIRGIDACAVKQVIMTHSIAMLKELGVPVVCEGVETAEEAATLAAMGVDLMQGYHFARPAIERLPVPHWPQVRPAAVLMSGGAG